MEELGEGAAKGITRLLSWIIRPVIWLVWELCFEVIAWYVGWPVCRVLSLGRFPGEAIGEHERASTLTHCFVSGVGLVLILGVAALLANLTGGSPPV